MQWFELMEGENGLVAVGPFADPQNGCNWGENQESAQVTSRGAIQVVSIDEWQRTHPATYPWVNSDSAPNRADVEADYDIVLPDELGNNITLFEGINDGFDGTCTVAYGDEHLFCLTCEAFGLFEGHANDSNVQAWHLAL